MISIFHTFQCSIVKYSSPIQKVLAIDEVQTFLLPHTKITIYADCPLYTLQHHPMFTENKGLPEQEIWELLDGIVAALAFLQNKKMTIPSLTLNDIYHVMTPFRKLIYKLTDPYIKTDEQSNFHKVQANANKKDTLKELRDLVILSPIQVENVRSNNKFPVQNKYKSNVFVLGAICLYCLDLIPTWKLYNWEKWFLNEEQLKQRLAGISVSFILRQTLQNMLEINEDLRMDFEQLNVHISSSYAKMQKQRCIQTYPHTHFKYDPYQQIQIIQIFQSDVQSRLERRYNTLQHEINKSRNLEQEQQNANEEDHENHDNHDNLENNETKSPNQVIDLFQSKKQSLYLKNKDFIAVQVGNLQYSNKTYYEGQINQGIRSGQGTLYQSDGQKLVEGEWLKDLPDGETIMYNYYEGDENNNLSYTDLDRKDWIKYEGQVKKGKRQGLGVITFLKNEKYTGEFIDDKANGSGLYLKADNTAITGYWRNNKFVN